VSQTKAQLLDGKSATIQFTGGSASAPSVSFTGDTNTGIYSPGADQVAISTNGTRRLIITSDGKVGLGSASVLQQGSGIDGGSGAGILELYDGATGNTTLENTGAFPIIFKTNGSERMRLDSSGRLGLGTSSPASLLTSYPGNVSTLGAKASTGILVDNNGSAGNISQIGLGYTFSSTYHPVAIAAITDSGSGSTRADLHFATRSLTTDSAPDTRMIIKSDGKVGIGTTGPSNTLEVAGGATSNLFAVKATSSGDAVAITARSAGNGGIVSALNNAQSDYEPLEINGEIIYFQTRTGAGTVSERARIDSSGRLLVGTSSARSTAVYGTPSIQALGDYQQGSIHLTNNSNSNANCGIAFSKIRGSSIVQNGDYLGGLTFNGFDGSADKSGATIEAVVDGTPGANDMPGRLVFSTTADGASSPTERVTITSDGTKEFSNGSLKLLASAISSGAGNSTLKYNTTTGIVTYDTSSRLVKRQIVDCPYGIDELKQLQPRKYFRTDDQREEIGFIADEMAQVMPEFVPIGPKSVVTKNEDDTEQIPIGVNYEKLTAVLTKALQEAITKIETLEAKVAALESA
jgi:hypothetical protein